MAQMKGKPKQTRFGLGTLGIHSGMVELKWQIRQIASFIVPSVKQTETVRGERRHDMGEYNLHNFSEHGALQNLSEFEF